MDKRKDLTRRLIAESFKALLQHRSFEKISIMTITDEAGIRRPSFYNHFQDKYDVLEWLVTEDVIRPMAELLGSGEQAKALEHFFSQLLTDRVFYRRAFGVTGQNGFEETFIARLSEALCAVLPADAALPLPLDRGEWARYEARCLVTTAHCWLEQEAMSTDAEQLSRAYLYLRRNGF